MRFVGFGGWFSEMGFVEAVVDDGSGALKKCGRFFRIVSGGG